MNKRIAIILIIAFWLIAATSIAQSMIQARELQKEINIQRNMQSGMA